MFKGMSQFKALFDEFVSGRLTGNEQLITLHINIAMNNAHWAKTIRLSDNSLLALLNQHDSTGKPLTLESVRRIKQKLKNKGLIDFTSGKGNQVSEYRLVKLYADEPCPHDTNDPTDTAKQSPGDLLYSNNSNNSTTEDIKTKDIEKKEKNAHARVFNQVRDVKSVIEYYGLELDVELMREWETEKICDKLSPYDLKTLSELQKKYGIEKLKLAMERAYHKYGRYTKVGGIQDFLIGSQNSKGEFKNGRNGNNVTAENRRNAWDD